MYRDVRIECPKNLNSLPFLFSLSNVLLYIVILPFSILIISLCQSQYRLLHFYKNETSSQIQSRHSICFSPYAHKVHICRQPNRLNISEACKHLSLILSLDNRILFFCVQTMQTSANNLETHIHDP